MEPGEAPQSWCPRLLGIKFTPEDQPAQEDGRQRPLPQRRRLGWRLGLGRLFHFGLRLIRRLLRECLARREAEHRHAHRRHARHQGGNLANSIQSVG